MTFIELISSKDKSEETLNTMFINLERVDCISPQGSDATYVCFSGGGEDNYAIVQEPYASVVKKIEYAAGVREKC